MADRALELNEKPYAKCLLVGWDHQWSDGGSVSSGLPRYLIEKLRARKIGEMSGPVSAKCYPFQVPGTHDRHRPRVVYGDGLPTKDMSRENGFYDAGNGLIIFIGEEPWFRFDIYSETFFQAVRELGVKQTVAVEGVNGAVPPDMERRISCVYSKVGMRDQLEPFGLNFSNYGTERDSGPTIGMALITTARFKYPEIEILRLGALAPTYPFLTAENEQVGIEIDHRSFYDITRRLNAMYNLGIDLIEMKLLADRESEELAFTLEEIAEANPAARRIIEQARSEFQCTSFKDAASLDPILDKELEDILRNTPESHQE